MDFNAVLHGRKGIIMGISWANMTRNFHRLDGRLRNPKLNDHLNKPFLITRVPSILPGENGLFRRFSHSELRFSKQKTCCHRGKRIPFHLGLQSNNLGRCLNLCTSPCWIPIWAQAWKVSTQKQGLLMKWKGHLPVTHWWIQMIYFKKLSHRLLLNHHFTY